MDLEDEQCKDVFAFYGLAMFCAQCLERQVAISLATIFGPQNINREEYDQLLLSKFEQTMGRLVTELLARSSSDTRIERIKADIRRSKDARNLLAHNYFWQRAAQFALPNGREAMLTELSDFIELFRSVDAVITEITYNWAEHHGVTQQDYQDALGSLFRGE